MKPLKKFSLRLSRETSLPEELFEHLELESLEIQALKFKEIPAPLKEFLPKLDKLEHFSFSCPELSSLDLNFFVFPRLKVLKLKGCSLKNLPEGLIHMPKLEVLDLSHNQLQAMPSWVQTLSTLHTLNLGQNLLEKLPECLFQLKNLKRLNIDSNRIAQFTASELSLLQLLQHLSLDGNLFSDEEKKKIMEAIGIWF